MRLFGEGKRFRKHAACRVVVSESDVRQSGVWVQIQELAEVRLSLRIAAHSGEASCHGKSYSRVEWGSLKGAFGLIERFLFPAQCEKVIPSEVGECPRRKGVVGRRQSEPARG